MNELNELNKSLNDGRFWIGLQKTGRIKWHWSAGEPALYLNWAPGQPDGRDCGMMLNGTLHVILTDNSSATTVSAAI